MIDYILGVSNPQQWHSEAGVCIHSIFPISSAYLLNILNILSEFLYLFFSPFPSFCFEESATKQGPLCLIADASWWIPAGSSLSLTVSYSLAHTDSPVEHLM